MVDLWVREEQCWTPGSTGRLLGGGPHRLSRRPGLALERRGMEGLPLFSHGGQRAKALQVGLSHTIVQPSERGAGGPNWEGASSIRLRIIIANPQQLMFTESLAKCLVLC